MPGPVPHRQPWVRDYVDLRFTDEETETHEDKPFAQRLPHSSHMGHKPRWIEQISTTTPPHTPLPPPLFSVKLPLSDLIPFQERPSA